MLTVLFGSDWIENRNAVLTRIADDVNNRRDNRILMVPELISHETERRLCAAAGDTCSRFAEVLTFSRLVKRVCQWCGKGVQDCLDNGGRLVAMAFAARQLHGKLKTYASVETNPEFLNSLVDAVDEFKRCCISTTDLMVASKATEGILAQKLEELALLLDAYDAVCSQGKIDPRDQMNWLLEELETCDFASSHTFYIDGFPDYTRQHMAVLEHLICNSPNVYVTVNMDQQDTRNPAFEKPADTFTDLLAIAKKYNIPYRIEAVAPRETPLHDLSLRLFHGKIVEGQFSGDFLRVAVGESVQAECAQATEQILELIHSGVRYRQIAVVCADITLYGNAILSELNRSGLPAYLAGTEDILDKAVISTVLHALSAALGNFQTKDVLRYLRSAASPISLSEADLLENYAYMWSVQGRGWLSEWTAHPRGLESEWTERDVDLLKRLNEVRESAVTPLSLLCYGFRSARKLTEQIEYIYQFLDRISLSERLMQMADDLDSVGDNRNAQILVQLWEILLTALEQLDSVLGESIWDEDTFIRLLKLLLSQYDVGTIPAALDTITVGSVSAMRCQKIDHFIVIGANEGAFPTYGSISGILTDQERKALRSLGVPLTGGAAEGLQIECSEIFGVFCGAVKSVYVSALADQPSYIWKRLLQMSGKTFSRRSVLGAAAANKEEAAAYLIRQNEDKLAERLFIKDTFDDLRYKAGYSVGDVSREGIRKLYGSTLNLSASQIDKLADCRLAYFLKYGLRADPRKIAEVDPAEFGTYVHSVLEQTAMEVCASGGFRVISLDETLEIARKYSDAYFEERFNQLTSDRQTYLFGRNTDELMMVVEELWKELNASQFQPIGFEVGFGDGKELPAIPVSGNTMEAQLRGFVDRVDVWNDGIQNYYRIVDYKTGQKAFDYCDVFNGLGLQMLLYLFALEQEGEGLLGKNSVPAGVQYFPARVPYITSDGELTDEEAENERKSIWKRKGLLLKNDDVLSAMDPNDPPVRLSCRRRKDGELTGDIADTFQLQSLRKYVFQLLGKMVDEISSGNVEPNPYTRGSSHNACRFCDFSEICHAATVEGRRNYKAMNAQQFWNDIEKEVGGNG